MSKITNLVALSKGLNDERKRKAEEAERKIAAESTRENSPGARLNRLRDILAGVPPEAKLKKGGSGSMTAVMKQYQPFLGVGSFLPTTAVQGVGGRMEDRESVFRQQESDAFAQMQSLGLQQQMLDLERMKALGPQRTTMSANLPTGQRPIDQARAMREMDLLFGNKEADAAMKRELGMSQQLLNQRIAILRELLGGGGGGGAMGGGRTRTQQTSQTSNKRGGEYHNVGGRPLWMPTSSSETTRANDRVRETGIDMRDLLSMILG